MKFKKFWISRLGNEGNLQYSFGVTAWNKDDAISILNGVLTVDLDEENITIEEISSLSELDQNHVIPNMNDPICRGIWFPLGYK